MMEILKLAKKYKMRSQKIRTSYEKFQSNYKAFGEMDTNVAKIYEITFFYFFTNTNLDSKFLEKEYRIKPKIFKAAHDEIKKYHLSQSLETENESDEKKYVCNLYSIKESLSEFRERFE